MLLTGIIEAFKLELFLHFLVSGGSFGNNPVLPFLHYLDKAAGMACSLSPELLSLPLSLKPSEPDVAKAGGSLEGSVPSFALVLDPDVGC